MLASECLKFRGRMFAPTEAAKESICQLNWAYGIIEKPNVVFQNGKNSHEVANEVIEQHEDILISHQRFSA